MNKAHLVQALSRVLSTRTEAVHALETVVSSMQQALRTGDKVVISGFGSFHVKMRRAKKGRNPRTGAPVPVPPRRAVRFRAAKGLLK